MGKNCMFWLVLLAAGCGGQAGVEPQPEILAARPQAADQAPLDQDPQENGKLTRRIIYNATLEIVVEDFSNLPVEVDAQVQQFDAFIADAKVSGVTSSPRRGLWKVRVPADKHEAFIAAARKLGEVHSERQTSQDVSEKFYDLQAQLENKKQEEQRLKELLDQHSGKLQEILAVEKEITRVRGEVEQLQGQLRVMTDLTAYSTVTLQAEEIKNYIPEQAATFSTRIGRAWTTSLETLSRLGQQALIAIVFIVPWLCLFGIPSAIVLWWARRRKRSRPIFDSH